MLSEDVWYISEWVVLLLMLIIPIFFYRKSKEYKREDNAGGRAFSLGYCFFFLITSVNQFFYIVDGDLQLKEFLGFTVIFEREINFTLLFEFALSTHISLMFLIFFLSFIPIDYPMEKYIQRWEKKPLTKLLIITSICLGILWVLFCFLGLPQPNLQNALIQYEIALIYEIILHLLILVALIALLATVIGFIYFYIKLAIKTTGVVRRKALLITFGILFMYISLVIGNLTKPALEGTWLVMIGPISLISGIFILVYGFSIKIM